MLQRTVKLRRTALKSAQTTLLAAAVASPVVSHAALATGWGMAAALPLAALQAAAAGIVVRGALPPGRTRALAVLAPSALLLALGVGARHSPADGLLAAAGLSHAMLHGGLLVVFAASLAPGRTPLVTRLARRLNPGFHQGMEGYTRAVTVAWCLFLAGEVAASAVLLALAPEAWRLLVTVLGLPLAASMALAEYGVRRWRFRHAPHTTLAAMVRGVRASAAGRTPGSHRSLN